MSCHPFYVSSCISNTAKCSFACLDLVYVLACDIEVPENIAHFMHFSSSFTKMGNSFV